MAASSKETDENPFSFKTFITKAEHGKDEEKKSPKTRIAKKTKKTSSTKNVDDVLFPEVAEGARKGNGSNPFSFKTFMKQAKTKEVQPHPLQSSRKDSDSSFSSDDDHAPALLPPPSSDPLGVLHDPVSQPTKASPHDSPHTIPSSRPIVYRSSSSSSSDGELAPFPTVAVPFMDSKAPPLTGDDDEEEEEEEILGEGLQINPFPGAVGLISDELHQELIEELKKVKAENEKLHKQAERYSADLSKERKRSKTLKEEVKTLKEKEAKETKALEDMVQKVEENLVTATKRATDAEATIIKLTKEIKHLQVQLSQANPQAIHKSYEDLLASIREKATFASHTLLTAVQNADVQLKELYKGAESLRTVSDVLLDIDKTFEIRN